MRVYEKRQMTQSGFWGHSHSDKMVKAVKQDVPAFWSVSSHGQPFNDERLTQGSSNHYKIASPPRVGSPPPKPVGPATEALATAKASLKSGVALFSDDAGFTPLNVNATAMQTLRQCALAACWLP